MDYNVYLKILNSLPWMMMVSLKWSVSVNDSTMSILLYCYCVFVLGYFFEFSLKERKWCGSTLNIPTWIICKIVLPALMMSIPYHYLMEHIWVHSEHDFLVFVYVVPVFKLMEKQLFNILSVVLNYIYNYLYRYGICKVILYHAVIMIHSALFTYILLKSLIMLYMVLTTDLLHEKNFEYRSKTGKNFALFEMINTSTNLIVHEHSTFLVDNSHCTLKNTVVYYSSDAPENRSYVQGGVVRRFEGEDVELPCDMTYARTINRLSIPVVYWRYNGQIVESSSRHNMTTTVSCDGDWISVKSTLRIIFVQEADYGMYNCSLKQVVDTSTDSISMPYFSEIIILDKIFEPCESCEEMRRCSGKNIHHYVHEVTHHAAFWKLEKIIPYTEYVIVPVGKVLHLHLDFLFMSFAEKGAIDVEYTVNNGSYDETCSGALGGCSLSTLMYFTFVLGKNVSMFVTNWVEGAHFSCFKLLYSACVCPQTYGEHKTRYHRKYYNESLKAWMLVEITHPKTIFVFPDSEVYSLFRNGHVNYSDIYRDLVIDDGIWSSDYLGILLISVEENVCLFVTIIEPIACYVLIYVFRHFTKGIWKLYCKYLVIPVKHRILHDAWRPMAREIRAPTPLAEIHDTNEEPLKNYVFISCCEEEKQFVEQILISVLESWGLRVYLHSRDALPGELKLKGISEAICKTEKVIIVLSDNYAKHRMVNGFELNAILARFYDRKINGGNILFLKYRPCVIPRVFVWDPDIEIHDWTTFALDTEDRIRQLRIWFFGKKKKGSNCVR